MSVNRVTLLGRLGQDPEMKYAATGNAVCNFSVATSESWTDKSGQKQEKTEWHRIVVWGKLAELCHQYLKKGRQAYIEGKLQTRSWDGQDGQKRYTTEILAATVQFLGSNTQADNGDYSSSNSGRSNSSANTNNSGADSFGAAPAPDYHSGNDSQFTADDIPF